MFLYCRQIDFFLKSTSLERTLITVAKQDLKAAILK